MFRRQPTVQVGNAVQLSGEDTARDAAYGTAGMLLLAVVAPGIVLNTGQNLRWSVELVGAIGIIGYSAWRMSALVAQGRFAPVEGAIVAFIYVFLGLAPLLQLSSSTFPWGGSYDAITVWKTYAVLYLGMFAYEVGLRWRRPRHTSRGVTLSRVLVPARVGAFAVLAIASVAAVSTIVGWETLFESRVQYSSRLSTLAPERADQAVGTLTSAFLRVPILVASLSALALLKSGGSTGAFVRCTAIVVILVNLTVNNPISSARAWFGAATLSLVILLSRGLSRRMVPVLYAAGLIALFVVIFPYADVFRASTEFLSPELRPLAEQLTTNGDYDAFQQLMNAVLYCERVGFGYGRQMLGSAFAWVPRSLWTTKPIDTADLVSIEHNYSYTNLSMPLWGELYVDAWLLGVSLGFVLIGSVARRLDTAFNAPPSGPVPIEYAAVPFVAAYAPLLIRGDLMSTLSWFLFAMGAFLLLTSRNEQRPTKGRPVAAVTA